MMNPIQLNALILGSLANITKEVMVRADGAGFSIPKELHESESLFNDTILRSLSIQAQKQAKMEGR